MLCLSFLNVASADVVRKRLVFKSQRALRPLIITLNSRADYDSLSITEEFLRQVNLKENYSFN